MPAVSSDCTGHHGQSGNQPVQAVSLLGLTNNSSTQHASNYLWCSRWWETFHRNMLPPFPPWRWRQHTLKPCVAIHNRTQQSAAWTCTAVLTYICHSRCFIVWKHFRVPSADHVSVKLITHTGRLFNLAAVKACSGRGNILMWQSFCAQE